MDINSTSLAAVVKSETLSPSNSAAAVADNMSSGQRTASVGKPNPKQPEVTFHMLTDKVAEVNQKLLDMRQSLAFSVDKSTQTPVVTVIDQSTDEVIKKFPSDGALARMQVINDYLDMVKQNGAQSKEGLTGLLFNEII